MRDRISGGCLCEGVQFSILNRFEFLLYCHCRQCRQISGSAHASNLFSATGSLEWSQGEHLVQRFRHPNRNFTKAFCRTCGSGLPYVSSDGHRVIVPAGSLHSEPEVTKKAKVFLCERANWSPSVSQWETFERFPDYFDD